jgi:hypothetical protein
VTDYRRLVEEENPYLDLVRQGQNESLRSAMYGAAQTNPDVEADLRKLAEKVNVPVDTVRIDRKEIERQAILGEVDYDGLIKDSPVTANFLAEQADVARDDVSVLTRIDRTFRAIGQGWKQGSVQDRVEPLNWRWLSGEILSPSEQEERRKLLGDMQALGKTPERGDNPVAWFLGETGYTGRQLVSSVREGTKGAIPGAVAGAGAAALLGQLGPQVALPEEILTVPGGFFFGGRTGFITATTVYNYKAEAGFAFAEYEQMRDESGQLIDPAVARGAAAAAGLLNAGLETVGDLALAKMIPGLDRLLGAGSREAIKTLLARPTFRNAIAQAGKKWLAASSVEGVTESLQELGVILGRELAQGVSGQEFAPEAAGSDLMRVLESGAAGFAGGAGVGLPGAAISTVSNVREVRKANQTQQFMQALGEAAGESKLRERLPQVFQDYVARLREQGPVENVFIPADQFTQYWQSQNVDPEQVANEVGATNYTEAVATGSDVVIPIEAYATRLAPTPHHSGLMKDVRLAQGDLTIREVEALEARRKEVEAEIQTMMEQEGVEVETPAIEQVKQEVLGQLLGRFDRATADTYATMYSRAINALAQRSGIDPAALHEQYGLSVVTPLPDILQARAGVDTALDPLIDRLRSGDIPSRREIYGKSLAEFLRERGGVQDQGGELGARDAKLWDRDNRRVGEKALVSETGMTFDEARELALEAGFDVGETEQTFLDAMDREFRGEGVFMPGKERADLAELADALEGLEQFLGQQGIDVTTTDNATVKALIAKASEGMGDVGMQFGQDRKRIYIDNLQVKKAPPPAELHADQLNKMTAQELENLAEELFEEATYVSDETRSFGRENVLDEGLGFLYGYFEENAGKFLGNWDAIVRDFVNSEVNRGKKNVTSSLRDAGRRIRAPFVEEKSFFQAVSPEDKRGFIQFGADRNVRIGLLEKADLSTFIHETGHFYLEVLLDLAERADASPQIKADAETLMKWFKVKNRSEIGVAQHEMFARGNEAYLMEGNAPSASLRGIFQRARAWMTLIYRTLTRLDVTLNDEVRGVFDRIYATDKEIESANAELDVREVFASAQDAGMTEAEFAAYKKTAEAAGEAAKEKLQGRLIREYQREREKWWKAERAKMLEKVTEEVDSSPAYRAAAILTEGKLPDGVPVKLSRQALENRFGSEYLKRMPRFLRKVYTKDGGTDIDTAAEMLGFESGEALMTALINLRPRKELIEAETANRMAAEFGDMRMDGTIADEAMAAIHNSERANVLKAELVAIRRLQRQVRPVVAALRREEAEQRRAGMDMVDAAMADPQAFARAAAGRIGQMMARDISPGKYLLAERRASKAAFDAIRRKDYNAAATEKQRELLNHYMYLEARKAQQQLDRIYDYANKFDKKATRERLAKAGGGYLDQIDAILEKYEFRRVPLRVLARRQSLVDFAEQQAALGLIVNVPDQLLDEARLVNYKNASVDELRAVYDTVRNIEHLARLKDKLLRKAAAVEFQETKDELIKSATESDRLATTGELRIPNTVGEPLRARGAKAWRRFDAAILKVEQMVEWLDNGKIDGPWARFVFDLANDAQVKEYELHAMVTQKIQELTESMPKGWGDSLTDKVDVLLPGIESPVTRYTLISIAMNVGNDSNYQRLRDGYGWSDSSINAALGKLAKEDWDYIQGIWDAVNSLWPEIKALEERTSGVAPPKVEPRVVQTRFGDYRGGYFPLAYDPRLSGVGDKQAEATESVAQFMANGYGRARTDKGYTKQRVENLKAAVQLDYEQVLTSHLTKVIKDISHREAIFSLNKLLKDDEIKEVMIDRLGEARYREFTKWMQVLVSDRADTLHSGNVFSRAVMQFRTNMAIVTMGWKVTTMMAQFAGIGPSLDVVKPRFFTQALIDYNRFGPFSTHRETLEQFVYDRSGEMKFRTDNIDRDVRDNLRKLRGDNSPLATIRKSAFYLTAMADRQVTIPTWLGAYRQALAEGLGEEDAIRAGDRAVRLSQGAAGAKDLAAVQRDNELMKLLTMYYTPFSVLYARMRDVGATTRRVRDMPRAVARMLALVILPAVLGEILAGRGPDEDEDETWWAIRKSLLYPLASVPIVKEGSGVVEAAMIGLAGEGEMKFQPSWRLTPVAGSLEKLGRTFVRSTEVMSGDREFNDVAWDLLEGSGYVFGLPTRQVRISGEYTLDVLNDEANPESPQQFMYEVLYGPPKE